MENRLFIRKVLGSYILHKLEDNVLTILGDSQHTIGGIEPFYKISHKNCEAIALGYDLEEMSIEEFPYDLDIPLFETIGVTEQVQKSILIGMLQGTLIKGFKKALELNGDKKFSEEDMLYIFNRGSFYGSTKFGNTYYFDKEIQSLQQNEWDVEIEMRPASLVYKTDEMLPKLDSDGYIILTLKK